MVLEKREWIIIVIIAFILGILTDHYLIKSNQNNLLSLESENQKIYVQIAGEVKYPGVYEMEKDDRVFQLIEKAGGVTEYADISSINLSKKLIDGEKVVIFAKKETTNLEEKNTITSQTGTTNSKTNSNLININTATKQELESLPGIGPTLAQRIIDYREKNGYFQTIEDIKKVSGIGDKKFEAIKDLITVGP